MFNIFFLLILIICWQPLYLTVMMVYHLVRKDTVNSADYWTSLSNWFKKLLSLVFGSPGA